MLDIERIRNDFPMIKNNSNIIYFDNSATTFKPQTVIDEINEYYTKFNTNIHRGDYNLSYKISKIYDDTRERVRKFINAESPKEIVYTSGDTMSLNTVAFGYGLKYLKSNDVILTTLSEHASNILPWFKVCENTKASIKYIELNDDGTFNIDNYKKAFIDTNVKIVSIPFVSNVLGYINPIKEICKIAHDNGALVNVDAAQAIPHMPIDVNNLDVDFLSFSAHKMCGPEGIGILYGKLSLLDKTDPLFYGGGSNARFEKDGTIILKNTPEKFESGTPNVNGVIALNKAIDYLDSIGLENIHAYEKELIAYLISKVEKLDNIIIYNKKSDCGILSFNVKGIFAQDVASYLNKYGICVRSGNHCAKILHNVIDTNESIRISMYLYNTKEEIDRFVDVIKDITLEKCIGAVI